VKEAVAKPAPDGTNGIVLADPVWSAKYTEPVGVMPVDEDPLTVAMNLIVVPATNDWVDATRFVLDATRSGFV
jgi:hypothetical protein